MWRVEGVSWEVRKFVQSVWDVSSVEGLLDVLGLPWIMSAMVAVVVSCRVVDVKR